MSLPDPAQTPTFPDDVYRAAAPGFRSNELRMRVLPFAAAPGRRDTGREAAAALARELVRYGLFAGVELAEFPFRPDAATADAAPDLELSGRVLHRFDGSDTLPGRLETEIQVRDVRDDPPRLVWWARHTAESRPAGDRDFVVVQVRGRPARPAGALFRETAEVFSRMMAAPATCFPPPDLPVCPVPASAPPPDADEVGP